MDQVLKPTEPVERGEVDAWYLNANLQYQKMDVYVCTYQQKYSTCVA